MKTILWREWRWSRLIFVVGLGLFLWPYIVATLVILWPSERSLDSSDVAQDFIVAATLSLAGSQLTICCLGGNAWAGERSDRTAEFLAYLPIAKWQRMLAKLSLIAGVTLLILVINGLMVWLLNDLLEPIIRENVDYISTLQYIAVAGFVMFGVAWCVSSFQSSSAFAVCGGVITPWVISLCILMIDLNFELETETRGQLYESGFLVISLILGTLTFVFGTWYFLKRVEP